MGVKEPQTFVKEEGIWKLREVKSALTVYLCKQPSLVLLEVNFSLLMIQQTLCAVLHHSALIEVFSHKKPIYIF